MVESRPTGNITHVFVGRRREMAELTAALDDALSGLGRLVMLAGEPGIGKTRTARELASFAEQRGAQVLWGRCYEDEGTPPYWPWVQTIRSYVQRTSSEQLAAEMGPGVAHIAEIVGEIRGKLPELESPAVLEPEMARFRLFDSITTFLKNASQRQPLMLVLDYLHWADQSSLLPLEFVAREIGASGLLLVGAYRHVEVSRSHLLSQTLGSLVREELFNRVQLDGLTQQEVGELATLLWPRFLWEYETGEFAQGDIYLERLLEAMHQAGPLQLLAGLIFGGLSATVNAQTSDEEALKAEVAAASGESALDH